MIRGHSLKSLLRACPSSRTINPTSSSPASLIRQRINLDVRHNYGGQHQQTINSLYLSSSFGVRQFSSSGQAKDDNNSAANGDTNSGKVESTNGDDWGENDFSHLIQRKYDRTSIPTADGSSALPDPAVVPYQPTYYDPADLVIESIRWLHETTGLEYAWCLVAFVTMVRLGLLPLQLVALRNNSRIAQVGWIRKQIIATLNMNDPMHRARLANETKALLAQHGVRSIYSVLPQIVTVPFAIAFVMGWNKMCDVFPDDLATGGAFWFPDLTAPDPYYVLPVVNALTYYGVTEWVRNQTYDPFSPPTTSTRTIFRRGLAFLFIPLGANLSSALVLSWETFYLLSFGQILLFQSPAVKKMLNIWENPEQQQTTAVGNAVTTKSDAASVTETKAPAKRTIRRGGRKR